LATGLGVGLAASFAGDLVTGLAGVFGAVFAAAFGAGAAAFVVLAGLALTLVLVNLVVGFVGIFPIYESFILIWQNISSKKKAIL
jgi:hypothetical protein